MYKSLIFVFFFVQREKRGKKRFCNMEHAPVPVVTDGIDKEETVKALSAKYIDGLESPVKRLTAYLSKNLQ